MKTSAVSAYLSKEARDQKLCSSQAQKVVEQWRYSKSSEEDEQKAQLCEHPEKVNLPIIASILSSTSNSCI